MMSEMMARNWWILLIRGILAILFGLLALFMPGLTLVLLITFFAAYAIVDGVAAIFSSFSSRQTDKRWWIQLIEGSVGVIAGLAALLWPDIAAVTLLTLIAFWAVLTGVMQIIAAWRLRQEIDNEIWLGLGGLASIIFGVYVFLFPGAGALALAWLIGFYSVLFGAFFIGLALRLRRHGGQQQTPTSKAA